MDARWNLANKKGKSISYAQFVALTTQLKEFSEQALGISCRLDVKFMKMTKLESSFDFGISDWTVEANESAVTSRAKNLFDLNEGAWNKAKFVEVNLTPAAQNDAACINMQFGGELPYGASIYMHAQDKNAPLALKAAMMAANKNMLVGDGSFTNTGGYSRPVFARNEYELTQANEQAKDPAPQSFASFVGGMFGFKI